jgi:Carboxypeptidase regulatory-like domain/TonB dependent receptor
MWLRRIGLFGFVSLILAGCLSGQSPNGTINGLVLDPTGASIVGAEIRIANDATGVQYTGRTNGEGIYVVTNLPPGPYRLQVSKIGFKTLIKPDIILNVQDSLAINFTLPVGAASEVVTVTGGAPLMNTESGSVSTVIDRTFVESLPLNGRSFNTLLQLTPGVVIAPVPPNGSSPGQFSIAGQRTDANNFTVDGVSANFGVSSTLSPGGSGTGTAQAFSALGGTSSLVSVEALQEFRIETSSFAPEFGRSPGGQVILTTRSGTNDFHGGLYEYFRNTVMDANNWFNDAQVPPTPKAAEHHNDFGGYLGGPIWRDRTFFFTSYEGARLEQPQSQVLQVPSLYARAQAPAALLPYLNAYPQPNDPPTSPTAYVAPLSASFSNRATLDAGSVRVDHTFNDRFSIFGRYNDAPSGATNLNTTIPSNPENVQVNTQTLTVGVNMLLTPDVSNALRGNYSTQSSATSYSLDSFGGATPVPAALLLGTLPEATNGAFFLTFDTNSLYFIGPQTANRTKQLNFVDDLSWSVANHQLKFGADFRDIFLRIDPYQNFLRYFGTSVQDFISTGQTILEPAAAKESQFLAPAFSLYAQDTWKVSPRLTVTYGLRWELSPAPSARGTTTLAAWKNVNDPSELALAPPGTGLWSTTFGNFAPRVGLAYSLTAKGDFVLRIGGGVFYDLGVGEASALGLNFPNFANGNLTTVSVPLADPTPYLASLSGQPPFPTGVVGYSPDLKLPRSYQWNVALEKSLGSHQVISATYLGQAGRDLLRQEALPQPNSTFSGDFLLWQEDAFSNYNALQLQYRRPLSGHLQALLNYSWSHSLDNASNDVVAGLANTVISGTGDYASSDFDVRQSFSGAVTYAVQGISKPGVLSLLTKDWFLDTVVVSRTGFPFNATLRGTSPDPGGFAVSRPDLVAGQPLYLSGSLCRSTFEALGILTNGESCPGGMGLNPGAFSIPSTVRQGTEGRNDIRGFGLTQVDLSVGRKFPLTERVNLQFRADAFNLFNHPNFSNPAALLDCGPACLLSGTTLNGSLGGLNPLFQEGGPRSLQLSLKLSF